MQAVVVQEQAFKLLALEVQAVAVMVLQQQMHHKLMEQQISAAVVAVVQVAHQVVLVL
jgi:hypothetical protein